MEVEFNDLTSLLPLGRSKSLDGGDLSTSLDKKDVDKKYKVNSLKNKSNELSIVLDDVNSSSSSKSIDKKKENEIK